MRKSICFVVAAPLTARVFLRDHMAALSLNYDIYLMGNLSDNSSLEDLPVKKCFHIDIERGISLWRDWRAVIQAYKIFKECRFDAVHSVTPKAALITALAGKLAGIKHRTHIFTGQVWCTKKGIMRKVLKTIDKIIVRLDNHILVDGKSQRSFLESEGVLKKGQAEVFCNGSIAGVNSERFVPDNESRKEERGKIGIKDNVLAFIFLGRLNHDKGIGELYEAFDRLASEEDDVFLLLVGADEEGYIDRLSAYPNLKEGQNFHYYGLTKNPERVLNAGDVFVLPTYREGFGSSVLEAACIGLPCICSDAYGVLDAYIDGETGLKCKVGNAESLYYCMKEMHDNPDKRLMMGVKSRERVLRDFNIKEISQSWKTFYNKLLG